MIGGLLCCNFTGPNKRKMNVDSLAGIEGRTKSQPVKETFLSLPILYL
jgi:hypothetical protein